MGAGKYKHRVTVDEAVLTQDADGDPVVAWNRVYELWAAIEPRRGSESLRANQILAEMQTLITFRWSPSAANITAKHRLGHRGVIYNIAEEPREVTMARREIECVCGSGVNPG